MNQHKHLKGLFVFVRSGESHANGCSQAFDAGELKKEFGAIVGTLSKFYCDIQERKAAPGPVMALAPAVTTLPCSVVLSFEERPGPQLSASAGVSVAALLRRLADVAKFIPGPHQAATLLFEALDSLFASEPNAPETRALAELDQHDALAWPPVQRLLATPALRDADGLGLLQLTGERWQQLLARLRAHIPAAPAPAPAAPQPVTPAPAPFVMTQLMGWLSSRLDQNQELSYHFSVDGVTHFGDAAEYGPWGRLDVFGPDGSQLLTSNVSNGALSAWLSGDGCDDVEAEVTTTRALRSALAAPPSSPKAVSTVRGRLWFSDGRPFGVRTMAVFVKPALPQLIDDCCPPPDFAFLDGCGEQQAPLPILHTPQALAVTQTDQAGYFDFSYADPYPADARFAMLQVSGLAMPLALTLEGADQDGRASFPERVLLQVDSGLILPERAGDQAVNWLDQQGEDACGCHSLDFGEPNRALDEFKMEIVVRTTDPMVVRRSLKAEDAAHDDGALSTDSALNRCFRVHVAREQQVEWDYNPLLAQAVTISHGRILTFRQVWRADGYSLGDLRYSLPLAPLQKKNIAVIDWDRNDTLQQESTQDYQESLYNRLGHERDIAEIVNSALHETISGRSDSGGGSSSAGGGLSFGALTLGGSGGSSSAWSSSSSDATRTLAANFSNQLRDQTVQSANALRSQRITTVQQVHQSEGARVVTETVANRNACHAITVQYFEVLRHFRVDHELAAVRECLYIPLPLSEFTISKALRWRRALERYLPAEMQGALAACERLTADQYGAAPSYADEVLTGISGVIDLSLDFPLPPAELKDTTTWADYFGMQLPMASPLPQRFEELRAQAPAQRAALFEAKVAPLLAEKYIAGLSFSALINNQEVSLAIAAELDSTYRPGQRHRVVLRTDDQFAARQIKRSTLITLKVAAQVVVPAFDSVLFHGGELTLTTAHRQQPVLAACADQAALASSASALLQLPLRPQETQNRKDADTLLQTRLLEHLNDNAEYYHKAIWWTMDADRRFAMLDGYIAPNAGGRSVASVVENRLVSIIGNCLVMPVAPGIRLDYFMESGTAAPAGDQGDEDWLLARYRPLTPAPTTHIAVPTRGVFAESVMGSCNACEKIDDSRNWQYWQHELPDQPTAINPISLDSRAKDPAVVAPPPALPVPTIVNQVAASAPEPSGLAAAIAAVANGAAFRDPTGLGGTQQNARDALAQSYATTTRFGELSAEISKKQIDAAIDAMKLVASAETGIPMFGGGGGSHGAAAADTKKSIAADAANGRISHQQARDLTSQVNQHLVDRLGENAQPRLADSQEVRDAITRGRDEGSPVSITSGDARVRIGVPTRPAPAAPQSRRTWPLGRKSAPARAAAAPLPPLRIEIITAIRDVGGAQQVGEKSRQVLDLDCEKRTLALPEPTRGSTKFFWTRLKSVRNKFSATLDDVSDDVFELSAQGQTASGVLVFPDIDYRLHLSIDARRQRIRITGSHDGFPSYTVLVNGHAVYDYEQNLFVESYTDLLGNSDVAVERSVPYQP